MTDIELEGAWNSFCQNGSQTRDEKGHLLDNFLFLLLETTKNHIPLINRLNFGKHEVISYYIGAHFLLELEVFFNRIPQYTKLDEQRNSYNDAGKFLSRHLSLDHIPTGKEGKKRRKGRRLHSRKETVDYDSSSSSFFSRSVDDLLLLPSVKTMGSERRSVTSLRVHHSEESLSSAKTTDTESSAKVNRRKTKVRDVNRFRMKREGVLDFSELELRAFQSDQERDCRLSRQITSFLNCKSEGTGSSLMDLEDLREKEPNDNLNEKEALRRLFTYLTKGRGSRILMVLDQIGTVGATIGLEIIKYLTFAFEILFNEDIELYHGTSIDDRMKYNGNYRPMSSDFALNEIFKPYTNPINPAHPTNSANYSNPAHPRNSESCHLTDRFKYFFSDIKFLNKNRLLGNGCTPKRGGKRPKHKRSPIIAPIELDSEEEGGKRMRKRYFEYKRSLKRCECFHPDLVYKNKASNETSDDDDDASDNVRVTTLKREDLMNTILSVLIQYTLYDPFALNEKSRKIVVEIQAFGFQVLSQLLSSHVLESDNFIRYADPLIKLIMAGCQKSIKYSSQSQQFPTRLLSEELLKVARLLIKGLERVSKENQCKLVDSLSEIVNGIFTLLISVCCDQNSNGNLAKKLPYPSYEFLTSEFQTLYNDIYLLLFLFKSEKLLVIIQSLGKLILYFKLLIQDNRHKISCIKPSHKTCKYSCDLTHHYEPFNNSDNTCVIASLVGLLLKWFEHSTDTPNTCLAILHLLSKTKFCCCMKVSSVIPPLLKFFNNFKYNDILKIAIEDIENMKKELNDDNSMNNVVEDYGSMKILIEENESMKNSAEEYEVMKNLIEDNGSMKILSEDFEKIKNAIEDNENEENSIEGNGSMKIPVEDDKDMKNSVQDNESMNNSFDEKECVKNSDQENESVKNAIKDDESKNITIKIEERMKKALKDIEDVKNAIKENENVHYSITSFIETTVWAEFNCLDSGEQAECDQCFDLDHYPVENQDLDEHSKNIVIDVEENNKFVIDSLCEEKPEIELQKSREHNLIWGEKRINDLGNYTDYLFLNSFGPIITEHIARLILLSKWRIKKVLCNQIIVKCIRTLIQSDFKIEDCEPSNSVVIVSNLLKCLRLSSLYLDDKNLNALITNKGLEIISRCKQAKETRYETFYLLCCLVEKEQQRRARLGRRSDIDTEIFSNYYLQEIIRYEIFWRRLFDESSLNVRKKANINSLPAFHSLKLKRSATRRSSLVSEMDGDTLTGDESDNYHSNTENVYPNAESKHPTRNIESDEKLEKKDYENLVEFYSSTSDLWQITLDMLRKSDDFLYFVVESSLCNVVAPLLINIIQDYARASNNLLEEPSVVYKNLPITLSLCRSLLSTLILSLCAEGEELKKLLDEVRHHILRISSSHCSDIRSFISMLLQCSVLSRHRSSTKMTDMKLYSVILNSYQYMKQDWDSLSPVETEGYLGDTENNQPPTKEGVVTSSACESSRTSEDTELVCPELVICALDLAVAHHGKYLEAKELGGINGEGEHSGSYSTQRSDGGFDFNVNEKGLPNDHQAQNFQELPENFRKSNTEHVKEIAVNAEHSEEIPVNIEHSEEIPVNIEHSEEIPVKDEKCREFQNNDISKSEKLVEDDEDPGETQSPFKDSSTHSEIEESIKRRKPNESPVEKSSVKENISNSSPVKVSPKLKDWKTINSESTATAKNRRRKGKRKRGRRRSEKELALLDASLVDTQTPTLVISDEISITLSSPAGVDSTGEMFNIPIIPQNSQDIKDVVITLTKEDSSQETQMKENVIECENGSKEVPSSSGNATPIKGTKSEKVTSKKDFSVKNINVSTNENASLNQSVKSDSSPKIIPSFCTSIEECHVTVLSKILHDILIICRKSELVCLQLQRLSFLGRLIDGFGTLIKSNDQSYEELITIILNIWCEIAQYDVKPCELGQFFDLFKSADPPVSILLRALSRIFENSRRDPHYALEFPSPPTEEEFQLRKLEFVPRSFMASLTSLISFVEVKTPVPPIVEAITSLRNSHIRRKMSSCISLCAVICPIPRSLDWSLYNYGVSVATWISIQTRKCPKNGSHFLNRKFDAAANINSNTNETKASSSSYPKELQSSRVHVLSVGTQYIMFSLWVDVKSDKIYITASHETDTKSFTLNEACLEAVSLGTFEWHHIALVIPRMNARRGGTLKIKLLLDGIKTFEVKLLLPPVIQIRKSTPSFLLVGSTDESLLIEESDEGLMNLDPDFPPERGPNPLISYRPANFISMGLIFVFRAPILTTQNCLGLISLGKNAASLVIAAPHPHKIVFPSLINKKLLASKIDCSFLFKDFRSLIAPLQENLLLQYSPHSSTEYVYYKKDNDIYPESSGSPYPLCITQKAVTFTSVDTVQRQTAESALLQLGGASHLAFLVARIAELGKSEKDFADAISLFLKICRIEPIINVQFSIFGGANLICRLIKSPVAPSGVLVVKALMEACVEPNIIQFEACRGVFLIASHISCMIVDRNLLETLLCNWKCFYSEELGNEETKGYICLDAHGNPLSNIGVILSVICAVLNDICSYKNFNYVQLKDIGALNLVIDMFEEIKAEGIPLENICPSELIVDSITMLLNGKGPHSSPLTSIAIPNTEYPMKHLSTKNQDEDLSSLGLVLPDLKGSELMEVGNFLLLLHPDECTYISTDIKDAYYLTHSSPKPVKKRSESINFSEVEHRVLNSKFSRFSLQGDVSSLNSCDSSPIFSPIEEGEEALLITSLNSEVKKEESTRRRCSILSNLTGPDDDPEKSPVENYDNKSLEKLPIDEEVQSVRVNSEDVQCEGFEPSVQTVLEGQQVEPTTLLKGEQVEHTTVLKGKQFNMYPKADDESLEIFLPKETGVVEVTLSEVSSKSESWVSIEDKTEVKLNIETLSAQISTNSSTISSTVFNMQAPLQPSDSSSMQNSVIVGLLNAVEESLRYLSDTQSSVVISEMFSIDLVVLFANNPSACVRAAALGLIRTMLLKSGKEFCSFHMKRNVLHLIALQLHKHAPSSEALVAEAFALGLKLDLKLDDVTIEDVVLDPSHKISLFVPLFAVLPTCTSDIVLCHNTLTTFLHILKMNEELLMKVYVKAHFVDSLLLTMRNAFHGTPTCSDATGEHEAKIIADDIIEILCYLVKELVAVEGNSYFRTCMEVICQVNFFYRKEFTRCGLGAACTTVFLDTEGAVLESALHELRNASVNVHCLQNQFIAVPLDSSSSTNSDTDETKNFSRPNNFGNLSKLTKFFQRSSSTNKEQTRNNNNYDKKLSLPNENLVNLGASVEVTNPVFQRLSLKKIAASHNTVLQLCINYATLVTATYKQNLRVTQEKFALDLLDLLISSIKLIVDNGGSKMSKTHGLEYLAINFLSLGETFWKFLTHLMSSQMSIPLKRKIIHVLSSEITLKRILQYFVRTDMPYVYRFAIFVHDFRYKFCGDNTIVIANTDFLLAVLNDCGVSILPPPEKKLLEWSVVKEEKNRFYLDMVRTIEVISQLCVDQATLYLKREKLDLMHNQLSTEGNRVTFYLVDIRNERLKKALKRVKNSQCKRIKYTYCWRDVVDLVTHEKAPWHFPESYPRGWKLDGTEGPIRIRKRMMRCRLNIDTKFFHPHYARRQTKQAPPLQRLLMDSEFEDALSHIVESINEDENLIHTCHASFIAPTVEQMGEFLISPKHLYFIGEENTTKNETHTPFVISKLWPIDVVKEIHPRWHRLKDCALELFSTNGQSAFLAFNSDIERNEVMKILFTMHFPNIKRDVFLSEYTTLWREGIITNFEYLTQINKLAGRSFNDLMQYPVFPFLLCDYSSKSIDLEDSRIYRNLRKPIAIQREDKEEYFRRYYESSKQMGSDGPYHYGSHYSNSGIVLYYLVRLPPFTQLFLEFQDGNFDVPDRSFHSLETTWRLAASDSTTAIRELVPEFFFLPEAFSNTQGFKFGIRQNGEMVNHVILPPWCHGDPRKFILIHRALLESAFVTQHLQHWIDLVFGYKQAGKAAVEAINVFHPATYFGFDVEINSDELTIEARRTMIRTYGQTPRQLLTSPHQSPFINTFTYLKSSASAKNEIPQVRSDVSGIPWGIYAGSPADPKPTVVLVQPLQMNVGAIMQFSPNEVVLIAPSTVIHIERSKKGDQPHLHHRFVISWKHNDGVVRCRYYKSTLVYPLVSLPLYNRVTCCAIFQKHLWLGTESGQVLVYLVSSMLGKDDLVANTPNHPLIGHSAPVSCIVMSYDFKVCFSGGEDGVVILWDTNRLSYIRSVTVSEAKIGILAVSETLGDWVSVTYSSVTSSVTDGTSTSSVIRYYTINAEFIDSVSVESKVNCVTFSNAPEGRNVNVIVVGCSDRAVRLYSSWDLTLVRILRCERIKESPLYLFYTENHNHLCVLMENKILVVWETSQVKGKLPKFITLGGNV